MGWTKRFRALDERVLGRSDSTRGRLTNLFVVQAHPWLWPAYAVMAGASLIAVCVFLVRQDATGVFFFTVAAGWLGFLAFASRRIPR